MLTGTLATFDAMLRPLRSVAGTALACLRSLPLNDDRGGGILGLGSTLTVVGGGGGGGHVGGGRWWEVGGLWVVVGNEGGIQGSGLNFDFCIRDPGRQHTAPAHAFPPYSFQCPSVVC